MAAVRRLAAIMFTDVVGFTASTHTNEARALELLREHERRVRPILRRHHGREVKTIGDSFLVEFSSALDACRCALEIQTAASKIASEVNGVAAFRIRIGIHLGDVVHRGSDVFGDAVNIASRIEALAEPGGICVSQQVADQVANKFGPPLLRLVGVELRHVATPIGVYKVELAGRDPGRAVGSEPVRDLRRRLAVLPVQNLAPSADDDYLADGLTEELILRLSKVPGLHVLARSSIVRYKGASKSPGEIARELGVGTLLEGTLRAVGGRVRITTALVDPLREEPIWTEAYDRVLNDVLTTETEIAAKIAEALRGELTGETRAQIARPLTANPDAYAAYLRGRYHWNRRTRESLGRAIGEYTSALRADDRFALAHAGIADAYAAQALLEFVRPEEAFPKARAAAERALAIDPSCAEALTSLGVVLYQFDRNWPAGEAALREAIAANPNYAPAHHQLADLLKAIGRFDEALSEIRTALDLDPLSLPINTGVGHVLYLMRRNDEAIAQYRKTLDLDPQFAQAHLWFGRPFLEKGLFPEAIAELERASEISGGSTIALAVLAHAYAAAGQRRRALEIVRRLVRRSQEAYVPSYWIALIYVGLDDKKAAFRWLRRAYRERSTWLTWAKVEPRFDALRAEPEFAQLLAKMNLLPRPGPRARRNDGHRTGSSPTLRKAEKVAGGSEATPRPGRTRRRSTQPPAPRPRGRSVRRK